MRKLSKFLCSIPLFATLATAVPYCFAQELYAVLVGVGQYPNLKESLRLNGPPNDADLLYDYLTERVKFKEDHIIKLSDDGPELPTRANIFAALGKLQQRAGEGDFALLYFAGHGSQQPASVSLADEPDGYDEIFLPRDVTKWNKELETVENAIVDNEIRSTIETLRSTGVDVWAIFDSCHSGTMTRGLGQESYRTRRAPKAELEIPDNPVRSRGSGQTGNNPLSSGFADGHSESSSQDKWGSFVELSAAHATEETPEFGIPDKEGTVYGLFTYSLIQVLSRHSDVSYEQLLYMIKDKYASRAHNSSTPQINGTNLRQQVFNGAGEHASTFRAIMDTDKKHLIVTAGRLHGLDVGALVSLHENAGETEEQMGTGEVVSASVGEAQINPEWREGVKPPGIPNKSIYVRLLQPVYDPTVLIARVDTAHDADNARLREITNALEAQNLPFVEFSDYDGDADYFAAFYQGKFRLLRPGQLLPCAEQRLNKEERRQCKEPFHPEGVFYSSPEGAGDLVSRTAKAANLLKLQSLYGNTGDFLLDIEVTRAGEQESTPMVAGSTLHTDDVVTVNISNNSDEHRDIVLFYVDSRLGITPLLNDSRSIRILSREEKPLKVVKITDKTLGTESLVVISEIANRQVGYNYAFLQQDSYSQVDFRGKGESSGSRALEMLRGIWAGDSMVGTRSSESLLNSEGPTAGVSVFTWNVQRRTEN